MGVHFCTLFFISYNYIMDYPKYQVNFMPESYFGYCSTACFMGILNYFWYTQFNMKDTRDVMKIAKLGTYKAWNWLDQGEMAYALYKLWFGIEYFVWHSQEQELYSITNPREFLEKNAKEKYKKYIKDWKWIDWNGNTTFDLTDTRVSDKIMKESDIKKHYQENIIDAIQKNQSENVMFILWLSRYILFDEKEVEWASWWHVVLCKWIKDWKMEIYDSGPHKKPVFIESQKVVDAMNEMGVYVFVMVKHES